jgi:hypothetical protein
MSRFCFRCGQAFRFVWVVDRLQPLNIEDNQPHAKTCRPRKKARKSPNHKAGKAIVGRNYSHAPHLPGCNAPPWDECACPKDGTHPAEAKPSIFDFAEQG